MQDQSQDQTDVEEAHRGRPQGRAIEPLLELPGVRPTLRWVRRSTTRLLHPMRRRKAVSGLRAGAPPRCVLFVCIGNIYRSPYAALRFQAALPGHLRNATAVWSAGFVGPGRPSPADAVKLAATLGIDLTPHRSALLTREAVAAADLIVVMDEAQRAMVRSRFQPSTGARFVVLGDLDPEPVDRRGIVDPWDQDGKVLAECYARVDRCVSALIRAIAAFPNSL